MSKCKEISKLISDSMEQKLPLKQQLGIWLHLIMCKKCREYRIQMMMVRQVIGKYVNADGTGYKKNRLSGKSRNHIKQLQKEDGKKRGSGQMK
ncbi:MAG: hypothetical protein L3J71_04895 [Victivallaceae bacterium]|nr:hypothetical protein [Victivallaceae bacterium]